MNQATISAEVASRLLAERLRQVTEEDYTPEHDDEHEKGELARASACYAGAAFVTQGVFDYLNPFDWQFRQAVIEKDRIRQLEIAGAFIIAEIERLERKENAERDKEYSENP